MPKQPLNFYDDVTALERYLGFSEGTLRQIPIYARAPAVDAIMKVREMERESLFRPGLYYIVLVDLVGNTAFNAKYGDAEGDLRIEWFHTSVIEAIGQIDLENYVAFNKTIGDASLLIFSSFKDVYKWCEALDRCLRSKTDEYPESLEIRGIDIEEAQRGERVKDFEMKARRLVHLGEVSFKERTDPLSLAVSQTFKVEKDFSDEYLGCTHAVAEAITPKIAELGVKLEPNKVVILAGSANETMTYYVVPG